LPVTLDPAAQSELSMKLTKSFGVKGEMFKSRKRERERGMGRGRVVAAAMGTTPWREVA
jgi:hypothetical protein